MDVSTSGGRDTGTPWSGLAPPLNHFMEGRMIVVRRSATKEILSIICRIVDQMLSVVVGGLNRKLAMRSTHLTIVWRTGLVH